MRIHFIAIGGAAMHNLALALHQKGYTVTGSDDEIYEPSKSRLQKAGILPEQFGWFPEKINHQLDAVILGMHARVDNTELLRAQALGIKIYSYPEFLYTQTQNKKRVVIGGSHGKTTLTSMVMHVLKTRGLGFDYLVGSQIEGFELMANLDDKNTIAVFEGDEYLASPIDRRPKFHLYKADIGLITGIAWDHINVFPTFENYVEQFKRFAATLSQTGTLLYCGLDDELRKMVEQTHIVAEKIAYALPEFTISATNQTTVTYMGKQYPLQVFGDHNLMNLEGAREICRLLGIDGHDFYAAIQTFKGAAKRLELVVQKSNFVFYRDFAHSPSKLKATTQAIKKQFTQFRLIACMELHTFSSLNENFLKEYKHTLNDADLAFVYFNPQTIAHKKLKPISVEQVKHAFDYENLQVFTNAEALRTALTNINMHNTCLLMMSSGTFDGIDFKQFATTLNVE